MQFQFTSISFAIIALFISGVSWAPIWRWASFISLVHWRVVTVIFITTIRWHRRIHYWWRHHRWHSRWSNHTHVVLWRWNHLRWSNIHHIWWHHSIWKTNTYLFNRLLFMIIFLILLLGGGILMFIWGGGIIWGPGVSSFIPDGTHPTLTLLSFHCCSWVGSKP